ncbi:MAG: AAA family ATPase, partial [Phycisphaerae bacterium]
MKQQFNDFRRDFRALREEISKVIVGQQSLLDDILIALIAGGHVLLEGVPGLGKTLTVRTLADALHLSFHRIQFTPDLMPADITGTEILDDDGNGRRSLKFVRGPIFTSVLLADEINRTPPKTQAALLEAMQEHQVTAAGKRYPLEEPFFVLATQNPIEMEGTYPLPEAQLDRFMFNVVRDYLPEDDEVAVVLRTTSQAAAPVQPLFSAEVLRDLQTLVRGVPIAEDVARYAVRLATASRPRSLQSIPLVNEMVSWGAGLRAGQNLVLGGKALALLEGRPFVSAADIRALALPVLRHRILPG